MSEMNKLYLLDLSISRLLMRNKNIHFSFFFKKVEIIKTAETLIKKNNNFVHFILKFVNLNK